MKSILTTLLFSCVFATFSIAQTQQNGSFDFDGITREYIVFLPHDFQPNMPVVINLHGSHPDDALWMIDYTRMNDVADTAGYILVYPKSIQPRWNANCNIPGVLEPNVNDIGFISALIDTLYVRYNVAMNRIYCCGLNYGGWMASELICQIGHRFAAGARVNTSLGDNQAGRCTSPPGVQWEAAARRILGGRRQPHQPDH